MHIRICVDVGMQPPSGEADRVAIIVRVLYVCGCDVSGTVGWGKLFVGSVPKFLSLICGSQ